uniref:Glycosyltransferase n=1 Tax=Araucaria cunninghamii TaxID=56994 RepID=A0A0D6QRD6_ARACU
MESIEAHIMVSPFHGQGHVFPTVELCKRLAARGLAVTILVDASIAASVQKIAESSGLNIRVLELPQSAPPQGAPDHPHPPPGQFTDEAMGEMEDILRGLPEPPVCIIGDVMGPWMTPLCNKLSIPRASFFTSGACSLAFEHAIWKHRSQMESHDAPLEVPGFPPSMTLTPSDTRHGPPPGPPGGAPTGGPPPGGPPPGGPPPRGLPPGGPRGQGGRRPPRGGPRPGPPPGDGGDGPSNPPWMNGFVDCVGALVNTCRELESPFMEYVIRETEKPAWAVGPLLPTSFWEESAEAHDSAVRSGRRSGIDEERCLEWLNARTPASVLYVSFGSEVGPSDEEMTELALGLETAGKPFILVLQEGGEDDGDGSDLLPEGYESRVEGWGLVIRGWAPQLLILSHWATGGFLSHCGWNSTVESLGHGVPLLAWPIRGDQHYNAKLLVNELKAAAMVDIDGESGMVKRESVAKGVRVLMESEEGVKMREKARELKGLLRSSVDSAETELDDFVFHVLDLAYGKCTEPSISPSDGDQ